MGIQQNFAPTRSYNISLKIKGIEYTDDLKAVRVSSSLATGYQIVTLSIYLRPATIILNKLFGQDKILLQINLLDKNEDLLETMNFDLMIINSEFDVPISDPMTTDTQTEHEQVLFQLITVTRLPFQYMTTMVGVVFGLNPGPKTIWTGPKTIKEMIEAIVQTYTPEAALEYDNDGQNPNTILQCCIPPTTLYQAIKYLDKNFGIFDGAPVSFCQYDGTIQIMNLSARMKQKNTIFVNQMSTSFQDKDFKPPERKQYFKTYDPLYTNYVGNSKFGVLGREIKHIVLPSDELSYTITKDLSQVCDEYGLVSKTKGETSYINTSVANRTKYYIENNGFERSDTFINSMLAKEISDISRLSFTVQDSLAIENLIKVGSVVKLKTQTMEHVDIQGKYILFSSDIAWMKSSDWTTGAKLQLIRTNKTI